MKKKEELNLTKFLALAGVASRRKVVDEIKAGHITINDEKVVQPGYIVKESDVVRYKETTVKPQLKTYILLNKPKGYITSTADERGRKTVMELITQNKVRLYPVGRLDRNTTGLLLITNDGELSQKLAHPKFLTPKSYRVTLDRSFLSNDFNKLIAGLRLTDGLVKVDRAYIVPKTRKIEVVVEIHSGKNHIIRRMFDFLGYNVKKLDRFHYAGLTKKNLPCGSWRLLSTREIKKLKEQL